MSEHAVLLRFIFDGKLGSFESTVDDQLIRAARMSNQLEYDGYDVDSTGQKVTLYFYGRDASKMYEIAKQMLAKIGLKGTFDATLRFGSPDDETADERYYRFEL